MSTVLVARFQLLISDWDTATPVLRNINTYNLGDGNPIVLWHSVLKLENFMRRLTNIKVLRLSYLKHEHCSQQYSVRHVFMSIN